MPTIRRDGRNTETRKWFPGALVVRIGGGREAGARRKPRQGDGASLRDWVNVSCGARNVEATDRGRRRQAYADHARQQPNQ